MKKNDFTESEIIELLKNKNEKTFEYVYNKCRTYSKAFLKKLGADNIIAEDIYQDANIVLYQNLQKENFALTCSLQIYLNSVCRNKWLKILEKEGKVPTNSIAEGFEFKQDVDDWLPEYDENIEKIMNSLEVMKTKETKCYEILYNFFFLKKSMAEIATLVGYKDAKNAKNGKSDCQKKLKTMVLK